jgi:hypothetical protein
MDGLFVLIFLFLLIFAQISIHIDVNRVHCTMYDTGVRKSPEWEFEEPWEKKINKREKKPPHGQSAYKM